jgi:hypothetical protein
MMIVDGIKGWKKGEKAIVSGEPFTSFFPE